MTDLNIVKKRSNRAGSKTTKAPEKRKAGSSTDLWPASAQRETALAICTGNKLTFEGQWNSQTLLLRCKSIPFVTDVPFAGLTAEPGHTEVASYPPYLTGIFICRTCSLPGTGT